MSLIAGGPVSPAMENDVMDLYDRLLEVDLDALQAVPRNLHGVRFVLETRTSVHGTAWTVVRNITLSLVSPSGAPYTWGQIWRHQIYPQLMVDSQVTILSRLMRWRLIRPAAPLRLPAGHPAQRYRDERMGHCFFDPLRTYLEGRVETAKSEETRVTMQRTLARCELLAAIHAGGILESAIEEAAKSLRVRISITDIFGENRREFNEAAVWAKRFVYRNVRTNHLELCASEWAVEELSYEELDNLRKGLAVAGRSYLCRKNHGGIVTQLDTPSGRYTLKDPDREIFQAARDAYKLDGSAIDAIKEPQLAAMCMAACRVTSHARIGRLLDDDPDELGILDLRAAYTQAPLCGAYFQGYLTTISDVRRVELEGEPARAFLRNPGIYCVDRIDHRGCTEAVEHYLTELKLFSSSTLVLPSPELAFLWDAGVRFRLRSGAWGTCIPTIDWEAAGLLRKGTGPFFKDVALYKVWCGQLGHSNHGMKRQWFPGSAEWAAYLRAQGHDALFYDDDNDICVMRKAKRSPSNHHTFAFITSYTRIQVLQKLLSFNPASVRGVQLDSVVFVGDAPADVTDDNWRLKAPMFRDTLQDYSPDGWYGFDRGYDDSWITAPLSPITAPLTFLEGAGGSGKSHSVLSDIGFRDVLFAAPMWSLVCFMCRRYGRAGTTVHRLAGEFLDEETGKKTKCRAYHEEHQRYPAVVFVDEATMIDTRMLQAVIETYQGRSKLIIAGDIRVSDIPAEKPPIWFQCRNRTAVFDPRAFRCALVSYGDDYRATGPLVALKQQLRKAMMDVFLASTAEDPGDDIVDARSVATAVQTLFAANLTTADTCLAEYAPGDTILVGTHELADGWTEALKERDVRYRVFRHTAADVKAAQEGREAYLTGDIVRKKLPSAVFALAFTIHSFQGKTFSEGRLWIDARRAWDYAMLYTAISRCQRLEQIRILFE
jgi:hypothetical protein